VNDTGAHAFDLAIVGGGPVGLFLALAAEQAGLKPVVLEARSAADGLRDDRSLALSWSSCLRLARVGAAAPTGTAAGEIRAIHVSQAGHPGRTQFSCEEAGIPLLGRVVGYGDLVRSLADAGAGRVTVHHEHRVVSIEQIDEGVDLHTSAGICRARAAVVADGSGALLADAGFTTTSKDYGVHALVARVRTDRGPGTVAYERFCAHGPLAVLPRGEDHAVVWTLPADSAHELATAAESDFLSQLQAAFGWRAGRFIAVRDRGTYPLVLRRTTPLARGRIAVIGNAAQTLHPVAGQGLNLGIRDASSILTALQAAGAGDPFAGYGAGRERDRTVVVGFTDLLAEVFRMTTPGLPGLRALGLEALDLLPGARRHFARALAIDTSR
jgi:2-octaprenyl-6-methoxyphenol hydroxylase